jgi:ATP phosphoribosyltransferase
MIRIALPNKGRLADESRSLLSDAGIPPTPAADRALTARLGEGFEALFVRARDIPEYVSDGIADIGITGQDLVRETGRDVYEALDLGFGRCRLVVAERAEEGPSTLGAIPPRSRVATSFPRITTEFFRAAGIDVEVIPVSGAAEVAPRVGIAPFVVDLTSTGSTLRVNGLREVATVMESSARLIIRRGLDPAMSTAVEDLAGALSSVLRARDQRYVMANVPRSALSLVKEVVPGLSGPTVTEVLNGGEVVAVHAVVAASSIFRTINALRRLGGTGILVTRIERLVP